MLQIAVVDENPFIARRIGRVIRLAGHCAHICKSRMPRSQLDQGTTPDLVLIGQRRGSDDGWDCFNRWQETAPGLPLMLYALDDCQPGGLDMLRQTLQLALADLERLSRLDDRQRMTADGRRAQAMGEE